MRSKAQANLSALLDSTEDLIWSVDLNFAFTTFNKALQRYCQANYGIQIALGMHPEDIVPPERAQRWIQFYERALQEAPIRVESSREDGGTNELTLHQIVIDGKVTGIAVFGKDITDRKQAEVLLRESTDSLQEAQRVGGLGCYSLDLLTGIWTGSDVLYEIFGIDKNYDHTIAGWSARLHPLDSEMMVAYFANEVIGERKPFDKEYRIVRHSDQTERWVHGLGKLVFDEQGNPLRLHGVIKDITQKKLAEIQLRDSEERYRATFEQAAVGVIYCSFEGKILTCNARFAEIVGYTVEELTGMMFQQITPPEYLAKSNLVLQQLSSGVPGIFTWEKRYICKDGSQRWVRLAVSTQRDGEGRLLHHMAFVEDINPQKEAEARLAAAQEALRASETRYRTAFQMSLDAVNISRLHDGRYLEVNQGFVDMLGFEREEIIGRTSIDAKIWVDPTDRQTMIEALHKNASVRDLKIQFRKKNGELMWGLLSASLIEVDNIACVLTVTRDISSAKAAEDKIRNLAFYDPLTALPNRRLLLDRLRQALVAGAQHNRMRALLFVDLDHFKTLNDTLGHQMGDLLLQATTRRLTTSVRKADTVARLGGDEFVVILEDLSETAEDAAEQAQDKAEKILAAIARPYQIAGRECRSTASIGITLFGDGKNSADEVLRQADIAMDHAKAAGRNTMRFFSPALQAAVNARAAMEEDLRQSIKSNQFVLYYQPQVDHSRIIGAEVLVRWNHPKRGLLPPGEFIPLAEETGLVLPLGDWVLETACKQIAVWAQQKETAHLSVAVNISARQFRLPDFVNQVLDALRRTGANPKNLKLELTESMLANDIEEVIAKMTVLKSHGLRFSLDDFGTGYSSLAYLKRLPLDQLKIDRSFVQDILVDASSGAIAQTIISLSRAMGLPVIAEGVETEEQRDFLTRLGCHSFQGYLFSRPLPLEEFEGLWLNCTDCLPPSKSEAAPAQLSLALTSQTHVIGLS